MPLSSLRPRWLDQFQEDSIQALVGTLDGVWESLPLFLPLLVL
jgi:hypothetical protein